MFSRGRVEPLLICVCVPGAASFVVLSCSSVDPSVSASCPLVPTVLIAMTDIVPMLGAVMGPLEPGVIVVVLVGYPFVRSSWLRGVIGRCGGGSGSNRALQFS